VAALLCLAKSLSSSPKQSQRTAIFLATTAEETGKLGTEFYTMQPAVPLDQTILAINIDGLNIMGRAKDYIALGVSQTDQAEPVSKVMAQKGLSHRIDARLEDGMLFGLDTMFLFSGGVPAFTIWPGFEYPDLSPEEMKQAFQRIRSRYHTPDDEIDSSWKWDGSVQHLELLESLARFYLGSSLKPVMNRAPVFDALDPYVPYLKISLPSIQGLLLPFKIGTTHKLVQGWNGPYGHRNAAFYSYDFLMDIGTEVLAARDGTVAFVEQRFEDGNRISGKENVIVIDHGDGMFSRYYHLTKNGSRVEIGDRVNVGQVIGFSGDTGASAGPHLHFDVTVGCFQWGCQTVPIEFGNAIQNPLLSGRDYTALP
jgi:murein DD-endopeptidase MepM/ murein hydrolase activator NlpD